MSATVEYDTGPLSWVKSEIDHALQQTRDELEDLRVRVDRITSDILVAGGN